MNVKKLVIGAYYLGIGAVYKVKAITDDRIVYDCYDNTGHRFAKGLMDLPSCFAQSVKCRVQKKQTDRDKEYDEWFGTHILKIEPHRKIK